MKATAHDSATTEEVQQVAAVDDSEAVVLVDDNDNSGENESDTAVKNHYFALRKAVITEKSGYAHGPAARPSTVNGGASSKDHGFPHHLKRLRLALDAALQGNIPPSDSASIGEQAGDVFGFGFALDDKSDDLYVGAPFAAPDKAQFAGTLSPFHRNDYAAPGVAWTLSQKPFAIPNFFNGLGFGHVATGDGWVFVPLAGTPDDVNDPSLKDFEGEIIVLKKYDKKDCGGGGHHHKDEGDDYEEAVLDDNKTYDDGTTGSLRLFQKIPNPNPSAAPAAQFGYNLSYSHGQLLAAPLQGDRAYLFVLNENRTEWVKKAELLIDPEGFDIPTITDVLISGNWAFVGYSLNEAGVPPVRLSGRVAVFKRTPLCDERGHPNGHGDWHATQVLSGFNIGPEDTADYFGVSIALDCNTLVIGASGDAGQFPGGAAYVYQLCDGRWLSAQKLYNEPSATAWGFGYNVAINDGIIAIADPLRFADYTPFEGAIDIFVKDRCTREWVRNGQVITDPDGFQGELFGAGELVLTDKYLVASSNANAIFLDFEDTSTNPGRVLVWRVLKPKRDDCHDRKRKKNRDDCKRKDSRNKKGSKRD